jgi:hypothetical protein
MHPATILAAALSLLIGCKPEKGPSRQEPVKEATVEHEVQGQVFIATKGGANIKLGAVKVAIYRPDVLKDLLDEARTARAVETERLEKRLSEALAIQKATDEALQVGLKAEANAKKSLATLPVPRSVQTFGYDPRKEQLKPFEERVEESRQKAISADRAVIEIKQGHARNTVSAQVMTAMSKWPAPHLHAVTDADGQFRATLPGGKEFVAVVFAERRVVEEVEKYLWIETLPANSKGMIILSNQNLFSE